jgi:hypothetical protein
LLSRSRWPQYSRRAIYLLLLPCISACLSIGTLKYMHHFGLDWFSNAGEHWILHASLTHSISDDLYVFSLACVLDASAPVARDLRETDFGKDKMCPAGAKSVMDGS